MWQWFTCWAWMTIVFGLMPRNCILASIHRDPTDPSEGSSLTVIWQCQIFGDWADKRRLIRNLGIDMANTPQLRLRRNCLQAANLAGFHASGDPRFEAGIPDFMNGILNFSIHFNVVHRKVDWRNPKMKSLNSMPGLLVARQSSAQNVPVYTGLVGRAIKTKMLDGWISDTILFLHSIALDMTSDLLQFYYVKLGIY